MALPPLVSCLPLPRSEKKEEGGAFLLHVGSGARQCNYIPLPLTSVPTASRLGRVRTQNRMERGRDRGGAPAHDPAKAGRIMRVTQANSPVL